MDNHYSFFSTRYVQQSTIHVKNTCFKGYVLSRALCMSDGYSANMITLLGEMATDTILYITHYKKENFK